MFSSENKMVRSGVVCWLAVSVLSVNSVWAMAKKNHDGTALKTSMQVTGVKLSRENALAVHRNSLDRKVDCSGNRFQGTHAGNRITVEVEATGGDGLYTHTLVYNLGESFDVQGSEKGGQKILTRRGNGKFHIQLPLLKNHIPSVQQDLLLTTQDSSGNTVTSHKMFSVSRPVVLSVSQDPEVKKNDCREIQLPYESSVGVVSNGSTAPSHVEIKQGIERIWTSTKGWQFGVFFNPVIGVDGILVSLFSLNASYFTETSKQTVERIEIGHNYELNPGDLYQVYIQPTRYVTAYDASKVGACGETEKLSGAYLFQWWGFAYHVYPVDPSGKTTTDVRAIGAPAENTCAKDLDQQIAQQNGKYEFRGTNSKMGQ